MNDREITIVQLYPRDMNIYGDWGNVLTVKRRLEWHGYKVKLLEYNQGDIFPEDADIIMGGGGQDSGQDSIQTDLLKIAPLRKNARWRHDCHAESRYKQESCINGCF